MELYDRPEVFLMVSSPACSLSRTILPLYLSVLQTSWQLVILLKHEQILTMSKHEYKFTHS